MVMPGQYLGVFEHAGSPLFPFNPMPNRMNSLFWHIGREISRDTVSSVRAAGFENVKVTNTHLDVVRVIEATVPTG